MADMMSFPKTLDEFMEQYKIVDTEQVYTNGTELVPIFRIKQWEDALEQQECKKGHWDMVQMGRWIYAKCSECKNISNNRTPFCCYCGADMKGENR